MRALAGLLAAGAVVVAAPVAHAGPWDDPSLTPVAQAYVNTHHNAICEAISADPSEHGVNRVLGGLQRQDGFSYHDAADIVNVSVKTTCDQYYALLTRMGDRSRHQRQTQQTHRQVPVPNRVPIPAGYHWRYGDGVLV